MTDEQSIMLDEYIQKERQMNFYQRLRRAGEEGLLLAVKFGLLVLIVIVTLNWFTNVTAGSNNGTNAILYLNEAITKGYLPKAVNGQLPEKVKNEETSK